MKEIKSMLGSKSMKVPKQFDLYQLKTLKVDDITELGTEGYELVYVDLGTKAVIRINVYDRLLREMLGTNTEPRAKTEFLRTASIIPQALDTVEIDTKTREYLVDNIMGLYEIQNVKLYILQTGNPDTGTIATSTVSADRPIIETTVDPVNGEVSLDENTLFLKNYIEKKDAKLNTLENMVFEIDYPLDSRYYTSLSIGVSIQRI